MRTTTMTHASLFSGIGGFDLAARWAGWRNLFHCEKDPFCRKVLAYHFPEEASYEDITEADFSRWRGRVGVLSGGFPCQPFSSAGKRRGAADDRYLWPHMLRAVRQVQPAWVVGENVAGILSMAQPREDAALESQPALFGADNETRAERRRYVVETICADLEDAGYSVQPFLIPACAVGAPHRRDRVWFVAHADRHGREAGTRGLGPYAAETVAPIGDPLQDSPDGQRLRPLPGRDRGGGEGERADGFPRASSDTGSGQREACDTPSVSKTPARDCLRNHAGRIPDWRGFPAQSPVCRGNDGLPFDVDSLSIPASRWMAETIKAYGNAIVPQVAYEIFKAINANDTDYEKL